MNYKKIMAASLAATMVLGNAVVVMAADKEGSTSGEGETQYVATSDVFDVVLPVISDTDTTFDYLLDPDGLIAKTSADGAGRYTGVFEDGKTVYFKHATQVSGKDYTDTSDELKVVNKSTQAVDLTVSAKVTEVAGIKMASNKTFTNDEGEASTDTELYLALIGSDGTTPAEKAITAEGAELTASIPADDNAYEITWNATAADGKGQYERTLTSAAQAADYAGFKSYSFSLTGACNTGDGIDWSGLDENAPKVDLVWSVKDFTVSGPQFNVSETGLITITGLTAEKNYKSVVVSGAAIEGGDAEWDTEEWDSENGGNVSIQLGSSWMTWLGGTEVTSTITYTDDTTDTVTVTFAAE